MKYRDLQISTDHKTGARIVRGIPVGTKRWEKVSGPFPDHPHAELSLRRLQLASGLGNTPNVRKRIAELEQQGVRG